MSQSIEQRLLQAIKNDDVKAFAASATAEVGGYRLGRFPVLSILYLYKARKIISAYESELIKISDYEQKSEPAELSQRFSGVAGKCLRLYHDEVVSPLEMLLMLDKTKRLKRVYSDAAKTEEIKARLQAIYSIKYALNVRFEGDNIIIDKRPLSYREKKKIITASLCAMFGVAVAVGVPTITVSLIPTPIEGEVYNIRDIDFSSQKEYVLKRDVVLDKEVKEINCKISGKGGKLIFGKGGSVGTLNGTLKSVTIESAGSPMIETVSSSGKIEGSTVNVKADVVADENAALVATVNYGAFAGVTVNIKGSVAANAPKDETVTELTFGGMVLNNGYIFNAEKQEYDFGVIENCTVNYSQFELVGVAGANAAFGGIAGVNNAYLQNCEVKGQIDADTFDVAGFCTVNYGMLDGDVNMANVSQTSADPEWNPIACGIVINNYYTVENCENTGRVSAASTAEMSQTENVHASSAAGIAYLNRNANAMSVSYIVSCKNSGEVVSSSDNGNAHAAGVCVSSNGAIRQCENGGAVTASSVGGYETYVGGIADYAYGYIYKSKNSGDLSAAAGGTAYAGGISALTRAQLSYCVSSGDITVSAENVCAGGIYGLSEIDNYSEGTAEYCISENRLDVTSGSDGAAYVGGIAGYVIEQTFATSGGFAYFGGGVTDCCFIGSCEKKNVYFGNIVGACGENIYESNLYYSSGVERRNFDGNYYVNNSYTAFGATRSSADGGVNIDVEDKGATALSTAGVKETQTYKAILSELEKA